MPTVNRIIEELTENSSQLTLMRRTFENWFNAGQDEDITNLLTGESIPGIDKQITEKINAYGYDVERTVIARRNYTQKTNVYPNPSVGTTLYGQSYFLYENNQYKANTALSGEITKIEVASDGYLEITIGGVVTRCVLLDGSTYFKWEDLSGFVPAGVIVTYNNSEWLLIKSIASIENEVPVVTNENYRSLYKTANAVSIIHNTIPSNVKVMSSNAVNTDLNNEGYIHLLNTGKTYRLETPLTGTIKTLQVIDSDENNAASISITLTSSFTVYTGIDTLGNSWSLGRSPLKNTRSVTQRIKDGLGLDLKHDFGAVDDSEHDSTSAFEDWWSALMDVNYKRKSIVSGEKAYMVQKGPQLLIPEGNYRYDGDGLNIATGDAFVFAARGVSSLATKIYLPDNGYLWDLDNNPISTTLSDLKTVGGRGLVRFKSTARNVANMHVFERMIFSQYTKCPIEFNSIDFPNIKVRNNIFDGNPSSPTVGLAMAGLSANSEVSGNAFHCNRYHLKLGVGSNGTESNSVVPLNIFNNDFIRINTRVGACFDVWIVPNPSSSRNSGRGVNFHTNKFGQENIQSGDYHILVANENTLSGENYNADRTHTASKSTGFVSGLTFTDNNVNSENNGVRTSFILSYTANIGNLSIDNIWDNGVPTRILEFSPVVPQSEIVNLSRSNVFKLNQYIPGQEGIVPQLILSNREDIFTVIDPLGYLRGGSSSKPKFEGNDLIGYRKAWSGNKTSEATVAGGATKTSIDNRLDMPDEAATITMTNADSRCGFTVSSASTTRYSVVSLELRRPATLSVPSVTVEIIDNNTGSILYRRQYGIDFYWKRYPDIIFKSNATTGYTVRLSSDEYVAGTNTSFDVGMVHIYEADQTVNSGHNFILDMKWDGRHNVILRSDGTQIHEWIDSTYNYRWKIGQPTSDTDGVVKSTNPAT